MAKNPSGFAAEFAKQRAALGAGKTFTYQGKSYSTNRADDKPAKPAGMTSSPRPQAKPMASSPAPKARSAEFVAANGGQRKPNADGKYSPTEEMRLRNAKDTGMKTSPVPKARPAAPTRTPNTAMPARAAGIATPAAPKAKAAPMASPSASKSAAPASSLRPKARSAEFVAANGGPRKPNANGKYSPSEEMRLRNAKKGQ